NKNTEVLSYGGAFLRIISLSSIFVALGIILSGSLQGAGYTTVPMLITAFSLIIIQVPLALILPRLFNLGSTGIWWAIAIANLANGLLMTISYQRRRWQHQKV
ncbi:MAG: polysaccharide biosynthesis C-terminal domain-containing protein, partial [Gammaproteobacteria bacterium]|nr:polysaccharide biosynthesis C-terminal domain-containing protein [Gammaproteobacteria bacterium]